MYLGVALHGWPWKKWELHNPSCNYRLFNILESFRLCFARLMRSPKARGVCEPKHWFWPIFANFKAQSWHVSICSWTSRPRIDQSTMGKSIHGNHKHDDRIKLEKFVKQYGQVILDDQDLDEVEDAWGSCLVSYFARRFPSKMALIQLCNSYKVKYQYYVHNSGWLIFKFENDVDKQCVRDKGLYLVFGKPLMLKIMSKCFEFDEKEICTMSVWSTCQDYLWISGMQEP